MIRRNINKKAKGTDAERELVKMFWDNNWACVRVAGSGSSKYPSPDILASDGNKKIVMEVKTVADVKKYFSRQQVDELLFFAGKFCSQAWIGVKFKESQWYFIPALELEKTSADNYKIDLIKMKKSGFNFDEMITMC